MKADDLRHPYRLAIKVQVVYLYFYLQFNKFYILSYVTVLVFNYSMKLIIVFKHVFRKCSIEPRNARTDETPLIDLKNGFVYTKNEYAMYISSNNCKKE